MPPKQKKKAKTKLDTQEHAIKQILRAADLNPNYYQYFKNSSIDFNTLTELSAEDLMRIGITDEAERNALLRFTKMMLEPNSHLTNLHPFDIQKTVENTTSIVLLAHTDLILMKRDLEKMMDDLERHIMPNPILEFGHTSSSASLHFLELMDEGLHILENDFSMMLDSLDKNKKRKDCRSNQMILCVASSVLLTAIIGGFLVKRYLW